MQRNEYLDSLGLNIDEYGTNFLPDDDKRSVGWEDERKRYGFDSREVWNLDRTFVEWLYSHCRMYKDRAQNVVNLNFWNFMFNDKQYTQGSAIDHIIELTGDFLTKGSYGNLDEIDCAREKVKEACLLWAEILPTMWI